MAPPRGPFDAAPPPLATRARPWWTVALASLLTTFPVIALMPLMPPFGLLMLLGWRLLRREALPVWAPLALGLFDDCLSGQPFGSAMLLWTASFIAIDMLEERLAYRDFWQDWLIASGAIAMCLFGGRYIAAPLSAHVDTFLLIQLAMSILLFPLASWIVAAIDEPEPDR
jgi:rod shape-determining protein MreD